MKRINWLFVGSLLLAISIFLPQAPVADAGPFGGALRGAIGGGIAGRILGGRRGAIRGRRLGAAVGFIGGAVRASQRRAYNRRYNDPYDRMARLRYQETQREHDARRQAEQGYLEAQWNPPFRTQAPVTAAATDETLKAIQAYLMYAGFNPGPVDGRFYASTELAIRSYQGKYGLLQTGKSSPELLQHMRASK